jgi:hypothetical protein
MKAKTATNFCKAFTAVGIGTIGLSIFSSPATAGILWNEDTQGDLSNNRFAPTQLPDLMPGDNFLSIVLVNPPVPPDAPTPPPPVSFYRDLDYFIVTVPEGLILSKLILSQYGGGTSDDVAFIAMQQGTEFTEPPQPPSIYYPIPGITNPANLLGYALVGNKTTYGINSNCDNVNVNGQNTNLNGTKLPAGAVVQVGENLLPIMGDNTDNRPDKIQPNNCLEFPPPSGFTAPLTAGNYVFWAQQTAAGDTKFTLNFAAATVPEPTSALGLLAFAALGLGLSKKKF